LKSGFQTLFASVEEIHYSKYAPSPFLLFLESFPAKYNVKAPRSTASPMLQVPTFKSPHTRFIITDGSTLNLVSFRPDQWMIGSDTGASEMAVATARMRFRLFGIGMYRKEPSFYRSSQLS